MLNRKPMVGVLEVIGRAADANRLRALVDTARYNPHNPHQPHRENAALIPQRAIVGLIVGALGLPMVLCVLYALARLLEGMQDHVGAAILDRMGLVLFALWAIDLVALVIVSAINSLGGPDNNDER